MPINSVFSWLVKKRLHQIDLFKKYPLEVQQEVFNYLIIKGRKTSFGLEHSFDKIKTIAEFKKRVPIRTYEEIEPYIQRLLRSEQNVLWPTEVKWFAKSSGTTNGKSKFLPVTKEAIDNCHYRAGKDLLGMYYFNNPEANLYSGKHLAMGGSTTINTLGKDSFVGDLSAIIIKNLPLWVEFRRTPSKDVALIADWEEKLDKMAHITSKEDVTSLSGVPSWALILLNRILEITKKNNILEVWPNFSLYMHGGMNFKPYRKQFEQLFGTDKIHYVETYNSTEGFYGIQDRLYANDMLLMLDYGIFYEFLPTDQVDKENPKTLSLSEVEINKQYALVISTTSGLWRYLIGDTIKFTSLYPYRIQVTGRVKHFINAFGEEVIIENAEIALEYACHKTNALITDYTAAPKYMTNNKNGAHEWLIEFEKKPTDLNEFTQLLDKKLKDINSDYEAKRDRDLILGMPIVQSVSKGTFKNWLKSKKKLGGQNKIPRLSNDRKFIDEIKSFGKMVEK